MTKLRASAARSHSACCRIELLSGPIAENVTTKVETTETNPRLPMIINVISTLRLIG